MRDGAWVLTLSALTVSAFVVGQVFSWSVTARGTHPAAGFGGLCMTYAALLVIALVTWLAAPAQAPYFGHRDSTRTADTPTQPVSPTIVRDKTNTG